MSETAVERRRSSVAGPNYVVHYAAGGKTFCGRVAARVNCCDTSYRNEDVCRACAAALLARCEGE